MGLVTPLQCVFMDLDSVSVHKHAKKRTRPISSHLDRTSSHLVNNPYIQVGFQSVAVGRINGVAKLTGFVFFFIRKRMGVSPVQK